MKIYNLCDQKDFIEFKRKFPNYYVSTSFDVHFEYYYLIGIDDMGMPIYRLDGPTCKRRLDGEILFVININNGVLFSEKEYWEHPDVKAYAYLKEHPELEGFV